MLCRLRRLVLIILPLSSAAATFAETTTIYLSPQGDDAADGSAEHPLASPRTAQLRVRAAVAKGAKEIVVQLAAGRYVLKEPLEFDTSDVPSSADGSVAYSAAGGQAELSGGQPIIGWRVAGDLWVAKLQLGKRQLGKDVPPFRDLWVNGRRGIRARSPNEGYYRIDEAGPDGRTSFTVAAADLLKLAQPQTAEVAFLHDWSMSRVGIASIDAAKRTYHFADPIGANEPHFAIANFEAHPRYFIEHARELLDAPGEWFLDEATGELSYIPREGESPETAEVIAPRLEQLVVVRGEPGKPIENLKFSGITFSHSRYALPAHGYAGIQSAWIEGRTTPDDHEGAVLPSAVSVDQARRCTFENCRFQRLAACGLALTRTTQSQVSRCEFRDVGCDGVRIGTRSAGELPLCKEVAVEGCLVEDCGATFAGAVGVWVGYSSHITVAHNEIRNLPYTGVSVGWCWDDHPTPIQGHLIAHNHIHDVMQTLSDGGGVYTLGRQPGTRLSANVIHGVPKNAGRAESNGIFMDQGSSEMTVQNNTIYAIADSPIRFHMAGKNNAIDNRLATAPGVPIFTFNACEPTIVSAEANREIKDAAWQPPADDPAVKSAGRR